MPIDISKFFQKSKTRDKDIELPNESGQVDPRIKRRSLRGSLDKMGEGLEILKKKRKERVND